jgi:hypothetical protein
MEREHEILAKLRRPGYFGFDEVWLKTSFRCFRNINGALIGCDVEVFDGGPEETALRYFVVVTSDEGKRARSNPAPSVEIALATTHWGELESVGV